MACAVLVHASILKSEEYAVRGTIEGTDRSDTRQRRVNC
jgi:hypothetical protein